MALPACPFSPSPPPFCDFQVVTLLVCPGVGTFKQSATYGMLEGDHWDKTVTEKREREMMGVRGGVKGTQSLEQEEC